MAWTFGDGFDCYAALGDAALGYWDSYVTTISLVAGRFTGSQGIQFNILGTSLVKSSAVNDAVHHIVCAFRQTAALSGSTLGCYFMFSDGATNQCCIVFRSDGTILLTSATPAGSVLDTYTGAVTAQNTWFAFEFEVVINNTTGSWAVRKNGNTSNDHALGSLNTRPGTNSYANKLTFGMSSSLSTQQFDDLLWRSDASSVPWLGDIRCYTRMPTTDIQKQFSPSPVNNTSYFSTSASAQSGPAANVIWFYSLQCPYSGTITALTANFGTALTGHVNMAVYDATGPTSAVSAMGAIPIGGPGPGNLLSIATPVTNPTAALQTFTLATPPTVFKGQYVWVAMLSDAAVPFIYGAVSGIAAFALSFTYSSGAFPATAPAAAATSTHGGFSYLGITIALSNSGCVQEQQQDGVTTYVYDSTVNDADFYSIATIPVTPASTIAVTTRGFVQKSDAGTRSAAVQLKSGSTTVPSTSTALSTSWGWLWRTDTVDPATSAAWTASAVNAVQIGPKVTL